MLEVGWTELVLIMAIAVLVVGPSEIPALMVGLGRLVRRITYVKYAFSQQFDELMKQADMDDIAKSVNFETGIKRQDQAEKAAQSEQVSFDEAASDEDPDYIIADSPDFVEVDAEDSEPYSGPMLDGGEKMP